jgi:hypothetical protein
MRPVVLLIIALFVAVPAVLLLFTQSRPLGQRVVMALITFMAPFAIILLVNLVPALNGTAHQHPSAWRAVGVLLMTSSFILPWCLFAVLRGR